MGENIERSLRELARRAGLSGLPPAVVAAAGVVLALAIVLAMWRWWPRGGEVLVVGGASVGPARAGAAPTTATASGPVESPPPENSAAPGGRGFVTVHVVGAVLRPGVYRLPATARVCDAVSSAGGFTGNAAQEAVNLARVLSDGEQIVVLTRDEYGDGHGIAGSIAGISASGASRADGGAAGGTPVNINTADAAALDGLPGIGPSTATKIVADREANGPFATPDDLGRVPGIGPKKLEQLKDSVCVR